ncbi:MAG: class I SAM-dependent methyltransferase [Anaerolineaceae bacterium]|nr:class I SAM-dependent methyltransferase [Anaerolineaceae bacterium]
MASVPNERLQLLPFDEYVHNGRSNPLNYYRWPVIGTLFRRRVELCLQACPGGENILDVGFGSGVTFLNLAGRYRQIHGIDLDEDPAAVQAVFTRAGIETHLRRGDVLDLSYPDETFDAVLLVSILEHLRPSELSRAFAEVRRVLCPGGRMVYGTPVSRRLMTFLFTCLGADIRRLHFSSHTQIAQQAFQAFPQGRLTEMPAIPAFLGPVYVVGAFTK